MPKFLKKLNIALAVLLVCFAFFCHSEKVLAVCAPTDTNCYTSLAPLTANGQPDPKLENCTPSTCMAQYLQNLFLIAIGLACAMAVFMIVLGGVQYMSTDAIGKKLDGKARIQKALEGLALVILSWLIMSTINPRLVGLNFIPASTPNSSQNSNNSSNNNSNNNPLNDCTLSVTLKGVVGRSDSLYKNDEKCSDANGTGWTSSECVSKKNTWNGYHYSTTGVAPSGQSTNGCFKDSNGNYSINLFAGNPSDMRYAGTDSSAGTNYSTCESKKTLWSGTYTAFSASYSCHMQPAN